MDNIDSLADLHISPYPSFPLWCLWWLLHQLSSPEWPSSSSPSFNVNLEKTSLVSQVIPPSFFPRPGLWVFCCPKQNCGASLFTVAWQSISVAFQRECVFHCKLVSCRSCLKLLPIQHGGDIAEGVRKLLQQLSVPNWMCFPHPLKCTCLPRVYLQLGTRSVLVVSLSLWSLVKITSGRWVGGRGWGFWPPISTTQSQLLLAVSSGKGDVPVSSIW